MQGVVDQVRGTPDTSGPSLSNVSAPTAELRSTGVVQVGGAKVPAHASPSTLPVQPPTPAVTPARQTCRGGAGAVPGDIAGLAPGAPAQRAPAPQPRGSGRLSAQLVTAQRNPFPLGCRASKIMCSYTCTPAFTMCCHLHVNTGASTCAPGSIHICVHVCPLQRH